MASVMLDCCASGSGPSSVVLGSRRCACLVRPCGRHGGPGCDSMSPSSARSRCHPARPSARSGAQ
eukprot:5106313-Alexandrium_andersonii.AAC.1